MQEAEIDPMVGPHGIETTLWGLSTSGDEMVAWRALLSHAQKHQTYGLRGAEKDVWELLEFMPS